MPVNLQREREEMRALIAAHGSAAAAAPARDAEGAPVAHEG
jgi:hypothetical protein